MERSNYSNPNPESLCPDMQSKLFLTFLSVLCLHIPLLLCPSNSTRSARQTTMWMGTTSSRSRSTIIARQPSGCRTGSPAGGSTPCTTHHPAPPRMQQRRDTSRSSSAPSAPSAPLPLELLELELELVW